VNGSIRCSLGRFPESGELGVKTTNGGIDLILPDDTSAEISAKTLNGRVRIDLDLTDVEMRKKNKLTGTLGGGDGEITINTINGGITIKAL
jgi:DUF4097 and DUF4098 domain-containing protein YvlB